MILIAFRDLVSDLLLYLVYLHEHPAHLLIMLIQLGYLVTV